MLYYCLYFTITGIVSCTFSAPTGCVVNGNGYLYVKAIPQINVSPQSLTLEEGQNATFSCSILIPKGPGNYTFQWFRGNDEDILKNPGASKYTYQTSKLAPDLMLFKVKENPLQSLITCIQCFSVELMPNKESLQRVIKWVKQVVFPLLFACCATTLCLQRSAPLHLTARNSNVPFKHYLSTFILPKLKFIHKSSCVLIDSGNTCLQLIHTLGKY